MSSPMSINNLAAATALAALVAVAMPASPALARRDQDAAYRAAQAGEIQPLPDIRARMRSRMHGAQPVGEEYDPGSRTYRMKYLRAGSVIWVDVDARTGNVIDRSDN